MATQSARQAGDRPFYAAYGWTYDLLITHPVQPWAHLVSAALSTSVTGITTSSIFQSMPGTVYPGSDSAANGGADSPAHPHLSRELRGSGASQRG